MEGKRKWGFGLMVKEGSIAYQLVGEVTAYQGDDG